MLQFKAQGGTPSAGDAVEQRIADQLSELESVAGAEAFQKLCAIHRK